MVLRVLRGSVIGGSLVVALLVAPACQRRSHSRPRASVLTSGTEGFKLPPATERCGYRLEFVAVPDAWRSFVLVPESGPPVEIESAGVDHYETRSYAALLGPFVVQYVKDGRGQCHNLEIRQASCQGPVLYREVIWNGGWLSLRRRGDTFVFTFDPGGSQAVPLVAVQRIVG